MDEELSAKEIYVLDITGNYSKFRILSLLLYELAQEQDDLALAQVEGRALVQDARLGPVAVAGGGGRAERKGDLFYLTFEKMR